MAPRVSIEYERNFDTLLLDSIHFLFASASKDTGYDDSYTFARASVLLSILLLEAAANTCIESLALDRHLAAEIDRMPVLSKFEFYLHVTYPRRRFYRGAAEIQGIVELKKLRDGFVHMKPHKTTWEVRGSSGTAEFEKTAFLKIPKNPKSWDTDAAITTAAAVHRFLKYFLWGRCGFSQKKVAALLLSSDLIPGRRAPARPMFERTTRAKLRSIGIDIGYLGLAWA